MDTSENCTICLKDINLNDAVLTPCNHRYHSACFFKWIHGAKTCPICRRKLIRDQTEEEEDRLLFLRQQYEWELRLYNYLEQEILEKEEELKKTSDLYEGKRRLLNNVVALHRRFIHQMQRRTHRRVGLLL